MQLWLLIMGVDNERWNQRAAAARERDAELLRLAQQPV
jgi:hypothetical protein